LSQLLHAQSRDWGHEPGRLAEDYLAGQPALAQDPEAVLDLIYHEIQLRRRQGEAPALDEYLQRFPPLADQLPLLFEVNQALHPDRASATSMFRWERAGSARRGAAPSAGERPCVPGYEVLHELGRGSFGVVYQARQAGLNRVVALKVVLAGVHAGPEELERFRREAEAMARLQHPNIVQVHEVGEHDGRPFFSMEFCPGGSLADKLGGTPLPARQGAELVQTLARALHAAHGQGVVHRDLKPANVLLGADGQPKVADFGLAKRLDGALPPTVSGAILDTPSYMAPEQAGGRSKAVGPATDVYALGAVMYECLTGRPPFMGPTPLDTLLQVLADEPVPPRRLQPGLPRDLETVCLTCLQKEPGKRYATAHDLAEDVRRFLGGEPVVARPVGVLGRAWRWARRRPAAAALLAVSALAALALVGGGVAGYYSTWLRDSNARLVGALDEAGRQRDRADKARGEAEEARREKESLLYLMSSREAHTAWRENDVQRADDILRGCRPQQPPWEWCYLHRLCHSELLTLQGHAGEVKSVAWSPDGTRLASASYDRAVQIWDARTGQRAPTALLGHTNAVFGVAWSPDGTRLASASDDQTVRVWDTRTRRETLTYRGHTGMVYGVAWSPDVTRLASASQDRTVRVWDTKTGQDALSLKGHTAQVFPVAWSPDGGRLASGSTDKTVKVWDAKVGQEALSLKGHTDVVYGLAWSPDGTRLASASWDKTVKIWDARTGLEALSPEGHRDRVWGVAWSPDGTRLASASGGLDDKKQSYGEVKVWDARTGQEALAFKGHVYPVRCVAWSPDGTRLASACNGEMVKVWDARTGQEVLPPQGHTRDVAGVAWSPDGTRLAGASNDRTVKVWDARTGQEALSLQGHTSAVWGVAWSPDGTRLASGSLDQTVRVWDTRTGQELLTLRGHGDGVAAVAWSPDGTRLASTSGDRTVKIWDGSPPNEPAAQQGAPAR
jgi:WD40 repeat protein